MGRIFTRTFVGLQPRLTQRVNDRRIRKKIRAFANWLEKAVRSSP